MNTRRLLRACALVALVVTEGSSVGSQPQHEWHTRPDRWTSPRNFQTPFDPGFERYLSLTHQSIDDGGRTEKRISPNGAYWFGSHGSLPVRFTPETSILIFNERPYLIRLVPSKNDPDYFLRRLEWVNEKLVYIEIWWGSVLGSCYVFDVEKESFVYREMVNDGSLPFQQFQQHRRNRGPE